MLDNYLRLYVHLIWKTWDKLPLLVPDITAVVYPILLNKTRDLGGEALALGGVEDHLHLLVRIPATVSVALLVKELKGASSRHVHLTLPNRFFKWQGAYGALSVSPSALPDLTHYIENQADHHRRNYLQVELETVELLDEERGLKSSLRES